MAERTWIAVLLACLVWFGYLKFFAPQPVPQTKDVVSQNPIPTPQPADRSFFSAKLPPARTQIMDTGPLKLEISDETGAIYFAELNNFRESTVKDAAPIRLIDGPKSDSSLSAIFSHPELNEVSQGDFIKRESENTLSYKKTTVKYEIEKFYRYSPGSYYLDFKITLRVKDSEKSGGDWGVVFLPIVGSALAYDPNDSLKAWEFVYYQNESLKRVTLKDVPEKETTYQGSSNWIALGNKYFSTVVINQSAVNPDIVMSHSGELKGIAFRYPIRFKPGTDSIDLNWKIFIGPKDYTVLSQVPLLSGLIDYGALKILAFPLLQLLQFFYRFVHNYGIAIILLTVFVRLIFYPLSVKSARSMKAMQRVQPQLKLIQEKYKDDRTRLSQEQMALFKAHNVNPLGGCLPILVQLPVLFALYNVLGYSIELFQAPFFGWIQDLSAKDPWYVFPVLMGLAMLVQQRLMPTVGMDPMQVKMMYVMQVVFTFFMINLPSGLSIYMFVSTALGILQQWAINRHTSTTVAPRIPSG